MADLKTLYELAVKVTGASSVKELNKDLKNSSTAGDNLRRGFNNGAAAVRTFGAALAAAGVTAFFKHIINLGDELHDLSQRTGISVETLGKFKTAAELSGSSLEGVARGLQKLNIAMVEGQGSTSAQGQAFKALGINIRDASGNLKATDQLFLEVADSFSSFQDGAEKAYIAQKLFGKGGQELIPILNMGREEIQKYGLAISDDFARKADEFNDNLTIMKTQVQNLGVNIASEFLPALIETTAGLNDLFSEDDDAVSFFGILSAGFKGVGTLILAFANGVQILLSAFKNLAMGAVALAHMDFTGATAAWNNFTKEVSESSMKTRDHIWNMFADEEGKPGGKVTTGGKTAPGKPPKINPEADTEAAKAVKAAEKRIIKIKEETAALGLSNHEKRISAELAELEAAGLSKTSAEYQRLAREITNALDAQQKKSREWSTGTKDAFNEYVDNATDAAENARQLWGDVFSGMEDGLTEFVKTGKLNFKEFANSIIEDIIRIQIRSAIASSITMFGGAGGIGSLFGFANGGIMTGNGPVPLKKYATGGIANSPQLAMFGEGSMPEAYVPLPDGRNIPVALKGNSGGTSVSVQVIMNGENSTTSSKGDAGKLGSVVAAAVKKVLIDEKRPGGLLA